METKRVPAGHGWAWISEAWAIFKRQPGTWIGIYVVQLVLTFMMSMIPMVGWLSGIISVILSAGVILAAHYAMTGKTVRVSDLFDGFKSGKVGSLIGIMVIVMLLALAGLAVMAIVGFFLFWNSATYQEFIRHWSTSYVSAAKSSGLGDWLMGFATSPEYMGFVLRFSFMMTLIAVFAVVIFMLLWFATPIVLFEGVTAWPAMKKSYRMCALNIWPLTVYGLALSLLMIAALLPLGLGLLIMGPVSAISHYCSYRDLVGGRTGMAVARVE